MNKAGFLKWGNIPLGGLLRIARLPNLLIIALTQYFTAIFLVGNSENWKSFFFDFNLFLLTLSTLMIAAAGYIINDYYDVKIDLINKPAKVVVGKHIKRRVVMITQPILNFFAIITGFYLSLTLGFLNFLAAFGLWLYSNQLKRLPFIGNFTVALLTALTISIVGIYYGQNQYLVHTYALFAFAISMIREIIKDIEDLKGDADFGCQTLPVVWGIRKTKWIVYWLTGIFMIILMVMALQLGNNTLNSYLLLLFWPMAYFIYKLSYADKRKDFTFLSNFSKLIMLSGILSMSFFYQ